MRRIPSSFAVILAFSMGVFASEAAAQGPPLAGPTLIDECQAITESGSYRLVDNLTFTGNVGCLQVLTDNVTLDLGGFEVRYTGISVGFGVENPFGKKGIAVRNGSFTRSSGNLNAISLEQGTGHLVEGVRVIGASNGIAVGENSLVMNSIANDNSGFGIKANCPSSLIGNVAQENSSNIVFPLPEAGVCHCADNLPNPSPCAEPSL